MTSLSVVGPALRHGSADSIETWEIRSLAEPATYEDVLEVVGITRGEDLGERTGVELVDHLAVAIGDSLECIALESIALGQFAHAHLDSPLVDDCHVTTTAARAAG